MGSRDKTTVEIAVSLNYLSTFFSAPVSSSHLSFGLRNVSPFRSLKLQKLNSVIKCSYLKKKKKVRSLFLLSSCLGHCII